MKGAIFYKSLLLALVIFIGQVVKAQSVGNVKEIPHSFFPLAFPLNLTDLIRISSDFGYRIDPINGKWDFHKGIDLVTQKGKPIYATASGKVTTVGFGAGYGNYVVISHFDGMETLYGHLWLYFVKKDEMVLQGQLIGAVGSTGHVTGAHLHYEVSYNETKLDPAKLWEYYIKTNKI